MHGQGIGRVLESARRLPATDAAMRGGPFPSSRWGPPLRKRLRCEPIPSMFVAGLKMDWSESTQTGPTPFAGKYVHAVGLRRGAEEGTPQRVAMLRPEYGTVSPQLVKE